MRVEIKFNSNELRDDFISLNEEVIGMPNLIDFNDSYLHFTTPFAGIKYSQDVIMIYLLDDSAICLHTCGVKTIQIKK